MTVNCTGGIFLSKTTKRILLLLRTQIKTENSWGIVGGKKEPSDLSPHDTLMREIKEEIGFVPDVIKTIPLEQYVSMDDRFFFTTYVIVVENEFIPTLNNEHSGYCWVETNRLPKSLHNGVRNTLHSKVNQIKINTILDCFT